MKVINLNSYECSWYSPMNQQPLELEPGSGHDVEALHLEVEELKREEDRIRSLRQEKEDQLRVILFKELINK